MVFTQGGSPQSLLILAAAAFCAGAQNAIAGGGSFLTLPALMYSGLDARAANITSTIALFPGQLTTGWVGREQVAGAGDLTFRTLVIISLAGGAIGAGLLLATPPTFFARLVPWLVLFATAVFAWGSFLRRSSQSTRPIGRLPTTLIQFGIAIYGGYFGGGIGFLMLAGLTLAGLAIATAGATKNVLAGAMNASAVAIFALTAKVDWARIALVAIAAVAGGVLGAHMLKRIDEKALRILVVIIGAALTVGLFWSAR